MLLEIENERIGLEPEALPVPLNASVGLPGCCIGPKRVVFAVD
jgi:hypothetical protein